MKGNKQVLVELVRSEKMKRYIGVGELRREEAEEGRYLMGMKRVKVGRKRKRLKESVETYSKYNTELICLYL